MIIICLIQEQNCSETLLFHHVYLWNNLPEHIRNSVTITSFKSQLINHCFTPSKIPCFYSTGPRYLSFMHSRLRNNCSNLNNDLFLNWLSPNSTCDKWGSEREDAEHYFMQCPFFSNERLLHPLSVNTLLQGRDSCTDEENRFIFKHFQIFINDTKRFDRN